jgi:AcrR family transcriptional regulator
MKHSAVKQRIIETASRLFYDNGYNLTGINQIIAEASIAKATLYSHFKSKEDICLAYIEFKNTTFLEQISAFCLSKPKGEEQLIAIFDFLLLFFKDKDFNGCWCIRTVSEIPKENKRIKAEIQKQKNNFIRFITNLIAANQPDKNDKEQLYLARQIYLLYESAVGESHLHQDSWPILTAKKMITQVLRALANNNLHN